MQNCQVCNSQFAVDQTEQAFYLKMGVPLPTFCYPCRLQRRLSWRNERSFFRRSCARTGKDLISIFPPNSGVMVVDRDLWWADGWDALEFACEFNPAQPFFLQLQALTKKVPFPALFCGRCENTFYSNHVGEMKDCYLTFACWANEGLLFCNLCSYSKDCVDCTGLTHSELCYECVQGDHLYHCRYSIECEGSSDCFFCFDCVGCQHCFGSTNLRHKKFVYFNQQLSEVEYLSRVQSHCLNSRLNVSSLLAAFELRKKQALHRFAKLSKCEDTSGDYLVGVKDSAYCFHLVDNVRDCRYSINGGYGLFDCYDSYGIGANAELFYEAVDCGEQGSNYLCDVVVWSSTNVSYSINCHSCSDCFGCVGLRKKSYCILNKQYGEQEYKKLRAEIVEQMNLFPYMDSKERVYRYGEFFATELSPFGYNDTLAFDYLPLTEEQCKSLGFAWRTPTEKAPRISLRCETIPDTLPENAGSLLNEVIECRRPTADYALCPGAFRLTQKEIEFYCQHQIPLPDCCPACRLHQRNLKRRAPFLNQRTCSNTPRCNNKFLTAYETDDNIQVFCEACFQEAVL